MILALLEIGGFGESFMMASLLVYVPNTVSSRSFLAFPRDRNGFSQATGECSRSSPMESSVTWKTGRAGKPRHRCMLGRESHRCGRG